MIENTRSNRTRSTSIASLWLKLLECVLLLYITDLKKIFQLPDYHSIYSPFFKWKFSEPQFKNVLLECSAAKIVLSALSVFFAIIWGSHKTLFKEKRLKIFKIDVLISSVTNVIIQAVNLFFFCACKFKTISSVTFEKTLWMVILATNNFCLHYTSKT